MSLPSETPSSRIDLGPGVWVDRQSLELSFTRSRGPGGQSVNKVSSAVQMRVPVTAIVGLDEAALDRLRDLAGHRLVRGDVLLIRSDVHRSQRRNRDACFTRLHEMVLRARVAPRVRKRRRPTRGMIERRLENKWRNAEKKQRRGGEWD